MRVHLGLIKTALRVLSTNAGRENLTEELIGLDIGSIMRQRTLPAHQIREALAECRQHGWAVEEQDDFGLPTWRITPEGETKLRAF